MASGTIRYRYILFFLLFLACILLFSAAHAQCSICTRTAQQLGEKPAKGLNAGIIYLAFMPLAILGFIGFRWWQHNRNEI